MNKRLFAIFMAVAMAVPIAAFAGDDLADRYFAQNNPKLTPEEKAALSLVNNFRDRATKTGAGPFSGENGSIRFVFGAQHPSIVCAVLQVCDMALQAGEHVSSIMLGDTARWTVEPAISGTGATEIQHLIIKPLDVGLETSLVATTNRRTYFVRLRSHRTEYMPQVSFAYPEDAAAKWEALRSSEAHERHEKTIPQTSEYLGDLNFEYDLEGSAVWKPVRVYNDGRKTIIEMTKAMQQTESPSLLVVRKEGGIFKDDETVMVNYRVQGNRYIVDMVFDKAILIAGVGGGQDRVTITRRK